MLAIGEAACGETPGLRFRIEERGAKVCAIVKYLDAEDRIAALAVAVSLMVSEVWLVKPGAEIEAFTVGSTPDTTSTGASVVVVELPAASVVTSEKSCTPSARLSAAKVQVPSP